MHDTFQNIILAMRPDLEANRDDGNVCSTTQLTLLLIQFRIQWSPYIRHLSPAATPLMRTQLLRSNPLLMYLIYPSPAATPLIRPQFSFPKGGRIRGGPLYIYFLLCNTYKFCMFCQIVLELHESLHVAPSQALVTAAPP